MCMKMESHRFETYNKQNVCDQRQGHQKTRTMCPLQITYVRTVSTAIIIENVISMATTGLFKMIVGALTTCHTQYT